MQIRLASVMVDDQDKALTFYTETLGFVKKADFPAGGAKWLTVVSPQAPDAVELLLEPMGIPAARAYQKALFDAGIPLMAFAVDDIQAEYERLESLGVEFHGEPVKFEADPRGPVHMAILNDNCGNLIMIYEGPAERS